MQFLSNLDHCFHFTRQAADFRGKNSYGFYTKMLPSLFPIRTSKNNNQTNKKPTSNPKLKEKKDQVG